MCRLCRGAGSERMAAVKEHTNQPGCSHCLDSLHDVHGAAHLMDHLPQPFGLPDGRECASPRQRAAEIDTLAFHVVEYGADPQCRQTSIVSMDAWQQSKRADARHPSHCSQNSTRLEAAAATKLQRIAKIANIDGADCGSANSFHATRVRGEPKVSALSRSAAEWTSQPGRRRISK